MSVNRRSFLATGAAAALMPTLMPVRPARAATGLSVVATTGMIADAARTILGDLGEVRALMGPGVDPHAFRQTRSDIVAMTRADLTLYHGLYLEAQMEEFLAQLGERRPVLAAAEAAIPEDLRLGSEDYAGRWDPHVWMDPALWSRLVPVVQASLAELDPEGAEAYAAGAEATSATLARLDANAREVLSTVPQERRPTTPSAISAAPTGSR